MKKKNIVITLVILTSIILLVLVIDKSTDSEKERLDTLLENISQTKSVVVYGGVSNSEEYIVYSKQNYYKYKTITNEEEVKEIIDILSNGKIYNGAVITKMPNYVFYLLDENSNKLVEFTLDPFTSSIINTTIEDTDRLYEIIEKDKIGYNCLGELDTYICNADYSCETIDVKNITDKDTLNFSKIVTTGNGYIYALISTNDNDVIKDFDSYFKKNYQGYLKQELVDNYILYIYNGKKELNLEALPSCSK